MNTIIRVKFQRWGLYLMVTSRPSCEILPSINIFSTSYLSWSSKEKFYLLSLDKNRSDTSDTYPEVISMKSLYIDSSFWCRRIITTFYLYYWLFHKYYGSWFSNVAVYTSFEVKAVSKHKKKTTKLSVMIPNITVLWHNRLTHWTFFMKFSCQDTVNTFSKHECF